MEVNSGVNKMQWTESSVILQRHDVMHVLELLHKSRKPALEPHRRAMMHTNCWLHEPKAVQSYVQLTCCV